MMDRSPSEIGASRDIELDTLVRRALAPELDVQRVLGQGASARVYLACDTLLDRWVTVKVLHPDAVDSADLRGRFEREARAVASIDHPRVVTVYRFGVLDDGNPYLVMRYVRGRTLAHRLAAEGALRPEEARVVIADIAEAIDAAHARGVIHRDIRPDNILLEEGTGRAVLGDFGIAAVNEAWAHARPTRLTATGQVLGDPVYCSPEQSAGLPVDEPTDLYSLGVVAYEMLTGALPHAGLGLREARVARLTGQPIVVPPRVAKADPQLADLIERCMAKEPGSRPKARALTQKLRGSLEAPDSPLLPLPVWLRRGWNELTLRRVPQWVAAVGAAGWIVVSAVDDLTDNEILPASLYPAVLSSVVTAIVVAAVLAWYHGKEGEQSFGRSETTILALIATAWLLSLLAVLS